MSKQLWYVLSPLMLIALLASACQPTLVVTETSTSAPPPTASPTASPIASPVPEAVSVSEPLWSFQTKGAIWGTPTIDDDTVYFGSDDGNLYALDTQTGSLAWKFTTQGFVRSQPAVMGGLVYFASDDGYLYAVDAKSGTQAWRVDIGNYLPRDERLDHMGMDPSPTGYDYMQSSPVVVDGWIYIGSLDGNVYSLAADTGKVSWTFKTGQKVRATPTLADGVLYIGSWDESMYALNALNGQMLWQTLVGGEVQSTALVANGLVYSASRKASVWALDIQTGEKKWEYDYGVNMWVESSPQMAGNTIYIGSSGNRVVLGLDSQSGNVVTTFTSMVFHWSTPVILNDMLYIGANNYQSEGGLFGLKLVDGKISDPIHEYWNFPVQKSAEGIWNGVVSSPVVVYGIDFSIIFFGGLDGKFYAVSIVL